MKSDAIVKEATRCGVAPLLYEYVKAKPSTHGLSKEDLETLRDVYLCNTLRNSTIWQELSVVLGAFQSAGIPVIALKGAHLAELVYGSPALRPMADLDLLVRENDLACAERCLLGLDYSLSEGSNGPDQMDYSRHHHLRPFVKSGAVPIEIHRNLTTDFGFLKIPTDLLWERAHDTVIAGVSAKVLCPEHLLLHLCLHAVYNHRSMFPLLYLCDISWSVARYQQQIDWSCVAAVAEEWGASRLVYSTLLLVEETLGLGIKSPQLETFFRHEAADREIVATLREFLLTPWQELPSAYRDFGECHGFRDRIRTLTQNLFPERTRMHQIYGLPSDDRRIFLYYLFRPVDLLVRRGRFMLELIFRGERIRPALEQEEKRLQIHRWLEECMGTQLRN